MITTYIYVVNDALTGAELNRWESSIKLSKHGEKAEIRRSSERYCCVAVLTEVKVCTPETTNDYKAINEEYLGALACTNLK